MEDKVIAQDVTVPEGYVLDEENSTSLHLVFKKKKK